MDYEKIYKQIIDRAKKRILIGYGEKHHIIPKCMGGSNEKNNIVKLTAKEHWLVHLILLEIYPEHIGLKLAIKRMMYGSKNQKRDYVISGSQFERLRIIIAKAHGEKLRNKPRKPFTEEHKRNISKSKIGRPNGKKGKKISENSKIKIGISSKGRISGDKNPMKQEKQRMRMKNNNPMHDKKIIKKFLGKKNPNSKKIKILKTGKVFDTVNDGIRLLNISRSKMYRMINNGLIVYI